MSTYLELCRKTAQECGIGDSDGTEPSAVTSQSGELRRIVDWVSQAWNDLQNRHPNWRWMRVGFTLTITDGDGSYEFGDATDDLTSSAITRFSRWLVDDYEDYPRIYLQSSGQATQTWMTYIPWNDFKTIWKIGANQTLESYPSFITIDPQNNLVFGPIPNATYIVNSDYQRSPQILTANGDIPECPPRFHDLIMYMAMEKYALYESAPEVLARAQAGKRDLLGRLEGDQLPDMPLGAPLA